MPLLSVIIPVYNEARTIRETLEKVNAVMIDKEIIVVDDGSTDETANVLREANFNNLKIIHHSSSRGRGSSLLTGLAHASGEFVMGQDAELEYDPQDYLNLLKAFTPNNADIVLGARFKSGDYGLSIHRLGNMALTAFFNLLFHVKLNDPLTCYKLSRRQTIADLGLKGRNFTIEIELIARALKKGLRIAETPINYDPRKYYERKKIRYLDGLHAFLSIIKFRFINAIKQ